MLKFGSGPIPIDGLLKDAMEGAHRGGRKHNGVVFGSKAVADEQRARAQRGAAASGRLRTAVAMAHADANSN